MHSSFHSSSSEAFSLFEKIEQVVRFTQKKNYQEKQNLINRIKNERKDSLSNSNQSINSSKSLIPDHLVPQIKPFSTHSKPQSFLSDLNDSGKESLRNYLLTRDKKQKPENLPSIKATPSDLKGFIDREFTAFQSEIADLCADKEKKLSLDIIDRRSEISKKSSEKSLVTVLNGSGCKRNSEPKLVNAGSQVQSRKNSESGIEKIQKKDSEAQSEEKVLSLFTSCIQIIPEKKKQERPREVQRPEEKEGFLSFGRMEKWIEGEKNKHKSRKEEGLRVDREKLKESHKVFSGFKFDTNYLKSYMDPSLTANGYAVKRDFDADPCNSIRKLNFPTGYRSVIKNPEIRKKTFHSNKGSEKKLSVVFKDPLSSGPSKDSFKKPVLLEIGLKGDQPLSEYFAKNKELTIFHMKSRQQLIQKFKHKEKSGSDLKEIRKKLMQGKNKSAQIEEFSGKLQKTPNGRTPSPTKKSTSQYSETRTSKQPLLQKSRAYSKPV